MVDWDEIYRLQQEAIENRKAIAIANQKLSALERRRAEEALQDAKKLVWKQQNSRERYEEEPRPARKRVEREPPGWPYDEEPHSVNAQKLKAYIKNAITRYPCSRQQKRTALFSALEKYPK